MYTKHMRFGFLTAFTLSFLLPMAVSAQSLGNLAGETSSSFTVSVSPQYPAPNSRTTLSFLSSSIDLANSTVTVMVGKSIVYKGSVRPVAIPVSKTGSVARVTVFVESGGAKYTQLLTIQPQDVVLIAEPISSTYALYPGKPSVPLEGDVRVIAVANVQSESGKIIAPSALSYNWTVDGTQIANSSGIGKSAIIVASPLQYRARNVSVSVASQDGNLVGGDSFVFSPKEPTLRIYENDPLLGIRFDRTITGNYTISGSEATLYAAPFSLSTTHGAPLVQWFLNGGAVQTGSSITLRPQGAGQGSASLSLTAGTGGNTPAAANLSLIFGAIPNTNFFGL